MNDLAPADSPLAQLISDTFGGSRIVEVRDAGQGRGVFSRVVRVKLHDAPIDSVVVKAPAIGPNAVAARQGGAYEREAFAYRQLLPHGEKAGGELRTLTCYRVSEIEGDPWFVLEDLSGERHLDQVAGLDAPDTLAITKALALVHQMPLSDSQLALLENRGPYGFGADRLELGLSRLRATQRLTPDLLAAFESLLANRDGLVDAYRRSESATLCHGDPRADNVIVDGTGPVLFDWQQIGASFGESDISWLMGTSLETDLRRDLENRVVGLYAQLQDAETAITWSRYRLGYLRPGLAVLLLAQRETTDSRTERLVQVSLERIGRALLDLEVPLLAPTDF